MIMLCVNKLYKFYILYVSGVFDVYKLCLYIKEIRSVLILFFKNVIMMLIEYDLLFWNILLYLLYFKMFEFFEEKRCYFYVIY